PSRSRRPRPACCTSPMPRRCWWKTFPPPTCRRRWQTPAWIRATRRCWPTRTWNWRVRPTSTPGMRPAIRCRPTNPARMPPPPTSLPPPWRPSMTTI
ncbi:hypothetical protein XPN_2998, partial [Xanthomonas arboricola pv. pruni MAFF 301427]